MRAREAAYVDFVRQLPCIVCAKNGPSEASHVPTGAGQTGMAMKVPDSQVVPKCRKCHAEWEERRGWCEGWEKAERYDWAQRMVKEVQALVIPGADDFDRALELAEMGLGRIEAHLDGTWAWISCWDDETTTTKGAES